MSKVDEALYRMLNQFWLRENDFDRLDLVKAWALIVVPRPPDWDRAAVRAEADVYVKTLTPSRCFVCRHTDRWLAWHHIVQIQNGGSNIPRNFVELCSLCHARVHPWMEMPRDGFVSIKDMTRKNYRFTAPSIHRDY